VHPGATTFEEPQVIIQGKSSYE